MIVELAQSTGNSIGFSISGKVTLEQEAQWIARLEELLEHHPSLNVMVVLEEGAGWGIDAAWQDIKWIFNHMSRLKKVAVVSSSKTWKWLVKLDSFFATLVNIEEKHFETQALDEAWQWLISR